MGWLASPKVRTEKSRKDLTRHRKRDPNPSAIFFETTSTSLFGDAHSEHFFSVAAVVVVGGEKKRR